MSVSWRSSPWQLLAREIAQIGIVEHFSVVLDALADVSPLAECVDDRHELAALSAQLSDPRWIGDDRGVAHQLLDFIVTAHDRIEFFDRNHR
jgi:hypothetical protein